jgi:hypothetical protein
MKKLQEFMINGMPLPETDCEDEDIKEKEIKEWGEGPALGGMGSDDVEPAAGEKETMEEQYSYAFNVEREKEAIQILRQKDTSLYGMTKTEARQILKDLGHSDQQIKWYETQKESKLNKLVKEIADFPGGSHDNVNEPTDNIYDGSALGAEANLGDMRNRFDPNADMEEPLYGVIKPYDTSAQGQPQTSPATRASQDASGYAGSIPTYPRSMGESKGTGPNGEPIETSCDGGEAGWRKSLKTNPEKTWKGGGDSNFGDSNGPVGGLKKESFNMKKLIERAVEKGYSKEQIKKIIDSIVKKNS